MNAADTTSTAAERREERYYLASQWQLAWRKFRGHRLAIAGGWVLAAFYLLALGADFIAPYDVDLRSSYIYMPPQRVRVLADGRLHAPFVYATESAVDMQSFARTYTEDPSVRYPVRLLVRGYEYRLLGLIPSRIHLFGVEEPATLFLFGTDNLGRDFFSRVMVAARVSLSIGLVGVALSFVLGVLLGGVSGYYGGTVDLFVQRLIEFLLSIPKIPLWMALAAALPVDWPVVKVYFGITIILSVVGWTGLARVVRGKLLQLREEDYSTAAVVAGAADWQIILRHLLPGFMSYLIVTLTLAIPEMILAETALSFLGIGLKPPAVSWGVLLQDAQNVRTVALYPWLLLPGLFIIFTVLAFNFLGDGARDAADPYR